MKIAVMGYSGSGKSTLSALLGRCFQIPVLHLDRIQFLPGWVERNREEAKEMVAAFMKKPAWVIDGNYQAFHQEERLNQADCILFLNFHRFSCLSRVVRRYRAHRNKTRADMAEGCIEKLDLEFIRWVLWKGRTPAVRRHFREIAARYPHKIIVLKNQRQLDAFLNSPKEIVLAATGGKPIRLANGERCK